MKPITHEWLARAMDDLATAQVLLAAALRARGLARAARFTWERTARETIAVYERVLTGEDGSRQSAVSSRRVDGWRSRRRRICWSVG